MHYLDLDPEIQKVCDEAVTGAVKKADIHWPAGAGKRCWTIILFLHDSQYSRRRRVPARTERFGLRRSRCMVLLGQWCSGSIGRWFAQARASVTPSRRASLRDEALGGASFQGLFLRP